MSLTAEALRNTLEEPIYNKVLHKEVGRGEIDYEVYVRTRELLALQTPADELVVPDELLFLVQHQTQELWLKCAVFEAANLVERLDEDRLFDALASLDRVVHIVQILRDQIRVLGSLSPSNEHPETDTRHSANNAPRMRMPRFSRVWPRGASRHASGISAAGSRDWISAGRENVSSASRRLNTPNPDLSVAVKSNESGPR